MAQPFVSVLIATRNNEDIIERCLQSVAAQTYGNFEVVVVNDASTDRTLEIAEQFAVKDSRVHVFTLHQSGGCPGARNEAMKRGRGEIFAHLDADATAEPDWLTLMVEPFADPRVAVTGGPDSVPAECSLVARCIDHSMHSVIATGGLRRGGSKLARYLPAGCNMFLRRSVVEEVGPFDGTMLWRGEEKEFLLRVLKAGYRIEYVPAARIWHFRRTTLRAFWRQMLLSGVARIDILRRQPWSFQPAHFVPAVLVVLLLLGLLLSLFSPVCRGLFTAAIAVLIALFLADGYLAFRKIGDPAAIGIAALTSALAPLGYGSGILLRLCGWPKRRP